MLTWTPVQTAGVSTAISAALLDVITACSMLLPGGQSLVNHESKIASDTNGTGCGHLKYKADLSGLFSSFQMGAVTSLGSAEAIS